MATKFTPRKKKITGTKYSDKITWVNKKGWKSTLTVNAGSGNDIINFKNSKYKNKLNGQAGNDKIYGGTNIDTIHGNTGSDLIYGYNGNDKLYGDSGNDKIHAGKGNDSIDGGTGKDKIWGDSGNNTLKGGAGNDTIIGGTGNDKIWGGKDNDQINAGKGVNTIYFNKGDGKDTVLNGKGKDTLVFASETKSTLSAKFSGNNLVITGKKGKNTVTLKDYGNGNHSAQYVTIGKATVRTDSLVAKNNITPSTDGEGHKQYTGTSRPDNIIVNDYDSNTIVNALASDDYIQITGGNKDSNWSADEIPYINTGSGNDTITLNLAKATVKIDANSGSDTIVNAYKTYEKGTDISWGSSSGYTNGIILDFKGNENLLFYEGIHGKFILGEQKDNDLIIKLKNGETLTLKDYYTVYHGYSKYYTTLELNGDYYNPRVEEYLELSNGRVNNITLNKNNNNLDLSKSKDKNIILATENANYNIKAGNGDGNEIAVMGNGNHNIEVGSGINNDIFVMNGPFPIDEDDYTPIEGDITIKTGNWNNNEERFWNDGDYPSSWFSWYHQVHPNIINIKADGNVNITTGKSLNNIYVSAQNVNITSNGNDDILADGDINTITSNNRSIITLGSSSYYSTSHHPVNTVYSNGNDVISVNDGTTTINLAKGTNEDSGKKYILTDTSDLVTVNGIFNADNTAIRINEYTGSTNYVYTHYDNEDVKDSDGIGTGHINIYKLKSDGSLTDSCVQINGNWVYENGYNYFDLAKYDYDNDKPVIDDYIDVICGDGTPYRAAFSSMSQYVDMSKLDDDNGTDIYAHEFSKDDDTLYDICSSVYVLGSNSNDKYEYEPGYDGNVTIKETGGNDTLILLSDTEYFRLFFDIKNDGSIGNDLIISRFGASADCDFKHLFSSDYYERADAKNNSLTIKDFFTEDGGTIENITAKYQVKIGNNYVDRYEDLNYNTLIKNGEIGTGINARNSIVADVVSWLNNDAHKYSSVSSALSSSGLSDDARSELRYLYSSNSYYYGQYWSDAHE